MYKPCKEIAMLLVTRHMVYNKTACNVKVSCEQPLVGEEPQGYEAFETNLSLTDSSQHLAKKQECDNGKCWQVCGEKEAPRNSSALIREAPCQDFQAILFKKFL